MDKADIFAKANPDKKFILNKLKSGELFASGHRFYKLDPENFNFDEIDKRVTRIDRDKFEKFLSNEKVDFDTETLVRLFCFQNYMQELFPNYTKNYGDRQEISEKYKASKENPMMLSAAFKEKIVSCAEMSLIAQMYMQHCGIKSFLYAGNMFTTNKIKDNSDLRGEAHAYLQFRANNKGFFYDPVNPITVNRLSFPAIMDYSGVSKKERFDFASRLLQPVSDKGRGAAYIEATDIYHRGRNWLYGFDFIGNNAGLKRMDNGAIKRIDRFMGNNR